ncbi:unnamed protein product [Dovyalis caffra]|uniref:Uncharacterized protein n=1 Tax=Dovyalis caffra TaxID=77055 RepID=A0AAV1SHQ7_9ROSI|nr:unnamed protein product [Dovyalis caffra]
MAMGYMEHDQLPKAVEMLKRALLAARGSWKPLPILVNACLGYLEGQADAGDMKELTTGKSVGDVLDQMKMNGFAVDEETQKILATRPSL